MKEAGRAADDRPDATDKDRLIEELREAIRARDEFVASAAHELRNPLTPILMQIGGLLAIARDPDRCRPGVLAPRLDVLERAVRDFMRRATVLLDISRIAAGNIQLEPIRLDLTQVVRDVAGNSAPAARMARCQLDIDLQEGVVGLWDRLAMEQVAENLLSNALKFGAGKPIGVTLRSDGRMASLAVRDQGIGISEQDRIRVFGRFERAVGQREHGGFGVGLWLVNRLVTAMGGNITIESAPGQGSTFTVALPLGLEDIRETTD